ncbi:MAG TPA: hypothetical protein VF518_08365 [Polyangia bacterium]
MNHKFPSGPLTMLPGLTSPGHGPNSVTEHERPVLPKGVPAGVAESVLVLVAPPASAYPTRNGLEQLMSPAIVNMDAQI